MFFSEKQRRKLRIPCDYTQKEVIITDEKGKEPILKSCNFDILYEDNHLLALNKPIRVATMGLPEGEETLLTAAKAYIAQKYGKTGNVYLGVVSRLDLPVSGVVLFARTSKAADRINRQFREHTVVKRYLAVVEGILPPFGTLRDRIAEESHHRKCFITQSADGKESTLHFRRLARLKNGALAEIYLETGRKHQIRLQMSHAGFPIFGDRKYASSVVLRQGIALHARSLEVTHPTGGERIRLTAGIPDFWSDFGVTEEFLATFEEKDGPQRAENV